MNKELRALEALQDLSKLVFVHGGVRQYQIIEKSLKALEIIKEKQVNVGDFIRCKSIEDYNDYCCYNEKEQLTREEYDLLKKVLL